LEKVDNELPTNGAEGLPDIKLEEKRRRLGFVKSLHKVLRIKEIVMKVSFLDECALCIGDKVVRERT
jgi:hypothetical protein